MNQQNLEASFSALVMSIASSAAMALGLAPSPEGELKKDKVMARFYIDLLKTLENKTQKNLTEEEHKLLQNILTDLQLKYVDISAEEAP
ncbi:MAG TPA: DUF1844 domain-containing protein [Pseudobdellovibrionaceae bacterium]|nr:DUF1844 domain-containing protein [Pseudobdellovibrionaceae bacterium]